MRGHGVSSISFTDRTDFTLADGSLNADTLVDAASQRLHKPLLLSVLPQPFLKPPHCLGSASIAQAPGRLYHLSSPRPAAPKLPRRCLLLLVGLTTRSPLEQVRGNVRPTSRHPYSQRSGHARHHPPRTA